MEGVAWCTEGIIYHLSDERTLDDLIKLREQLVAAEKDTFEKAHTHTDQLLSAVAKKLEKPIPDGVRETDDRFIGEFYYAETFPTSWEHWRKQK